MRIRALASANIAAVAALVAIQAAPAGATANDDWVLFHHDALHAGVSPDTAIGATHAPSLSVKWSKSIGGGVPAYASPVVAFNPTLNEYVVYAATAGGTVQAFNASTGASVWTGSIGGGVGSPALDTANNTVYIGDDSGRMTAFNATTGAVECTYQLGIYAPETAAGRIEEAPMIDETGDGGPILYFGDTGQSESANGGRFYALYGIGNTHNTAGTCGLYWMHTLANGTGKRIGTWSPPTLATDASNRELVIFGEGQPADTVLALDAHTGATDWTFHTAKTFPDADVGAGPTVSAPGVNGIGDGVVYIDGKDRIEYAIDLTTGAATPIWSFNMQTDTGKSTNSVSCASLLRDSVIVAYSMYVYSFNANTGAVNWRSVATTKNTLASVSVSGASGDEVVLIADLSGRLYAFRASDGLKLATLTLDAGKAIDASPAVANGMVFVASTDGNLYAVG